MFYNTENDFVTSFVFKKCLINNGLEDKHYLSRRHNDGLNE